MKPNKHSSPSLTASISRRAALERVVTVGLGLAALSTHAAESAGPPPAQETEFIPENDYPYFDYEPGNE